MTRVRLPGRLVPGRRAFVAFVVEGEMPPEQAAVAIEANHVAGVEALLASPSTSMSGQLTALMTGQIMYSLHGHND